MTSAFLKLALTASLFSTSAIAGAQDRRASRPGDQRADHGRTEVAQAKGSKNRSSAELKRHVLACQKRYPGYNSHTDRYTVKRGVTSICRL